VRLAFLELMAPDLGTAAAGLVDEGCDRVAIVPLFLGPGGHVRRDLPALVETLRTRYPGTSFELHPPVGEIDTVIDAMAAAAAKTLR